METTKCFECGKSVSRLTDTWIKNPADISHKHGLIYSELLIPICDKCSADMRASSFFIDSMDLDLREKVLAHYEKMKGKEMAK